ncbi:hypothetical protein ACO0LF_28190 [Undibacterium sp. Di27W]|uniref:hypothetical protein n=1 Tax=Undibacterium sp. Di27W TaxID=3413036 RepID=UPI003BF348C2
MSTSRRNKTGYAIASMMVMLALAFAASTATAAPPLPIRSGLYTFKHKFAEQPDMPSLVLTAKIRGQHIVLINRSVSDVFPKGVIAEGTLMWHAASKQWIIGTDKADRYAKDVGGCSAGPDVIDLRKRIYWTC